MQEGFFQGSAVLSQHTASYFDTGQQPAKVLLKGKVATPVCWLQTQVEPAQGNIFLAASKLIMPAAPHLSTHDVTIQGLCCDFRSQLARRLGIGRHVGTASAGQQAQSVAAYVA